MHIRVCSSVYSRYGTASNNLHAEFTLQTCYALEGHTPACFFKVSSTATNLEGSTAVHLHLEEETTKAYDAADCPGRIHLSVAQLPYIQDCGSVYTGNLCQGVIRFLLPIFLPAKLRSSLDYCLRIGN